MLRNCIFILLLICSLYSCAVYAPGKPNPVSTELNLNRKYLGEIPDEVFDNKQLKVLRLYQNKLVSIPARIGELENLEELYIGKNQLTHLPPEIGRLKKLKILSVQYNRLSDLPEEIGELENLEQLILNQNYLKTLPSAIGKLSKLSKIQLNYNEITSLPEAFYNCTQLQFVQLNRNDLESISPGIGQLKQLRELSLVQAGRLLQLPEELCGLRLLELLEVDQMVVVPSCALVNRTNRLQIRFHY